MPKRKKKSKLKLWISLIVIFVLIASVVGIQATKKDEGITVTTGKSTTGDITSVVTATGKIFPEIEVKISSEVAGEIIELPVTDGVLVKKGDLLVRVNPDTLEAQVKQQEAALSASKANAAQARAQLLKSELDLKRTESLFEKGFATQDELDRSKTTLEVNKAQLEASQFRIQQQEMQLREASDTLRKATTFAPIDGTITRLNSELGDRVVGTGQFAGTEIMRLADLSNMEVRVDVSEAEIIDVKIGDKAEIEIDSLPDEKFDGVVTEIANSAKTTGSGSQEQLTTFQVKVKLEKPDERYRPGMTATADIKTETVEGAVLVPLQAVTVRQKSLVERQLKTKKEADESETEEKSEDRSEGRNGGNNRDELKRVVFVVNEDKVILTPVETGIADSKSIQITDGLEADAKIVTGSYGVLTRQLKHESLVKERKNLGRGEG